MRAIAAAFRTEDWEALEQWFLALRQDHLESSVEAEDEKKRISYGAVAIFIKHMLSVAKEEIVMADLAERHPEPLPVVDYMPFDSGKGIPVGNETA